MPKPRLRVLAPRPPPPCRVSPSPSAAVDAALWARVRVAYVYVHAGGGRWGWWWEPAAPAGPGTHGSAPPPSAAKLSGPPGRERDARSVGTSAGADKLTADRDATRRGRRTPIPIPPAPALAPAPSHPPTLAAAAAPTARKLPDGGLSMVDWLASSASEGRPCVPARLPRVGKYVGTVSGEE